MKAWKLSRLGGAFEYVDVPVPEVRPGSVLVRVEAQSLMTYLKPFVEGKLPAYRAPEGFTPGGNAVGIIEAAGADVWHLQAGQRVLVSPHAIAHENVQEPGQILIGVTSGGGAGDALQASWKDGTLAEFALVPASTVTPLLGLDHLSAEQLVIVSRCVVPYGGLLRGRLAVGETVLINGATGAYGSAATLVALAMGAARVVIAGRRRDALEALARLDTGRIAPVALRGDAVSDAVALREAAEGGVHLAFDMVGGAADANSTMAALNSLYRNGRLVLMGSSAVPLPLNYMQVMFNSLEILGNFMFPQRAYLPLLALVRSGQLDLTPIRPQVFRLSDLRNAMDFAGTASNLEITVVRSDSVAIPETNA